MRLMSVTYGHKGMKKGRKSRHPSKKLCYIQKKKYLHHVPKLAPHDFSSCYFLELSLLKRLIIWLRAILFWKSADYTKIIPFICESNLTKPRWLWVNSSANGMLNSTWKMLSMNSVHFRVNSFTNGRQNYTELLFLTYSEETCIPLNLWKSASTNSSTLQWNPVFHRICGK